MLFSLPRRALASACLCTIVLGFSLPRPAGAQKVFYRQTDLVSNQPGAALLQDTDLVNAWGMSFLGGSPFWVSNNGTGTSTLYNVTYDAGGNVHVSKRPLTVTIPGAGNVTGQVSNGGAGFNGDRFLFVSEDGTISGWRPALGTAAETLFTAPGANYKGVTLSGGNLYAANFATGALDVYDGSLTPLGSFANSVSGYSPFNVQNVGGKLYVAYAAVDPGDPGDELAGAGRGFVDVFDPNTSAFSRFASGADVLAGGLAELNAPWGLALAPGSFGKFSNTLLVGNFGDGAINAFDPASGSFLGQLESGPGQAIHVDGLWGLSFGNGGSGGRPDILYFTAGPNDEVNGLFGSLQAVPEPGALSLLGASLLSGLTLRRHRRRG